MTLMMPISPISLETKDLRTPFQTLPKKLRFWLAYLTELLPPAYSILYIDGEGNPHKEAPVYVKKGLSQLRIHIKVGHQTAMRGIIHTIRAKEDAYKTMVAEQEADTHLARSKPFFLADKSLHFYTLPDSSRSGEAHRPPRKALDPIHDVAEIRRNLARAFDLAVGMTREEYAAWEREVGIDDDTMAGRVSDPIRDGFEGIQDWPREWFAEGTFRERTDEERWELWRRWNEDWDGSGV